jgi:hypothetical protein
MIANSPYQLRRRNTVAEHTLKPGGRGFLSRYHDATRFYERNVLSRLAEGSMMDEGRELSQVLMRTG